MVKDTKELDKIHRAATNHVTYHKKPRGKSRCINKSKAVNRQMEDDSLQKSQKLMLALSEGTLSQELEALTLEGLQILHFHKGFIRCNFVLPSRASDADGNWHVGAMATLIDDVGGAATYSVADHVKATLDLNISFYSTARIQEEVEIEAKVVAEKGKLSHVLVEVRRKENRELIALGKQWLAYNKDMASQTSKL